MQAVPRLQYRLPEVDSRLTHSAGSSLTFFKTVALADGCSNMMLFAARLLLLLRAYPAGSQQHTCPLNVVHCLYRSCCAPVRALQGAAAIPRRLPAVPRLPAVKPVAKPVMKPQPLPQTAWKPQPLPVTQTFGKPNPQPLSQGAWQPKPQSLTLTMQKLNPQPLTPTTGKPKPGPLTQVTEKPNSQAKPSLSAFIQPRPKQTVDGPLAELRQVLIATNSCNSCRRECAKSKGHIDPTICKGLSDVIKECICLLPKLSGSSSSSSSG